MHARKLSAPILVFASLAASLSFSAHAGTVVEMVSRNLSANGGGADTIHTWAQNGMMRIDTRKDSSMVFKNDTIYVLSHKDKAYYTMDRESMKRMAEQLNPAMKAMEERMKNMTPEQRAQMEKMMGRKLPGTTPAKEEIRHTKRTDKVAGYSCTYVEVLEDNVLTDEMCVVPTNSLKGADELVLASQKMAALMKEMMANIDAPWLKQMAEKNVANFEKLGGIPVLSRHFQDGQPQNENTLNSIRTETIAAAAFDVPAGYTKKDMMPKR